MRELQHADVDPIKELRLRRWARQNYVPPAERANSWHPIVLEEMRLKDAEMPVTAEPNLFVSAFVPLAPEPIHVLHEAHDEVPAPNMIRQTDSVRVPFHG